MVSRNETSDGENKCDNKECLTESRSSLAEEKEDNISKNKDKNMVPLRKKDEGAAENIYTSLDLNKREKLDVNEYETERSTYSAQNECKNHENQEEWTDSCSNCVLSLQGNVSFDTSYEEDIENDSNGMRIYEDVI